MLSYFPDGRIIKVRAEMKCRRFQNILLWREQAHNARRMRTPRVFKPFLLYSLLDGMVARCEPFASVREREPRFPILPLASNHAARQHPDAIAGAARILRGQSAAAAR